MAEQDAGIDSGAGAGGLQPVPRLTQCLADGRHDLIVRRVMPVARPGVRLSMVR